MNERIAKTLDFTNVFIALPSGFGMLDKMFSSCFLSTTDHSLKTHMIVK